MSDFRWHRGEPPKDGGPNKQYLVTLDGGTLAVVRWFEEWDYGWQENWSGWLLDKAGREILFWSEIPPVDWDALEADA